MALPRRARCAPARRAGAGLLLLAVAGCSTAAPPQESAAPPAAAPAPTTTEAEPPAEVGHEDDYDAPADELADHADHLDLSRLSPARREAVEQELERRGSAGEQLWAAYGPRLGAPATVRSLAVPELAFVLLGARADQLAQAVAAQGGLAAAQALPDVGAEADGVAVRVRGGCVAVRWDGDEYGRVLGAPVAAGTGGTVRERLARVRVAAVGEPACEGGPVALSPDADRALG